MPRVKSLIKKAVVETAKHARTCKFTNRRIPKDSQCIVVFDGPRERFCYSREVALHMIEESRQRLAELEELLE